MPALTCGMWSQQKVPFEIMSSITVSGSLKIGAWKAKESPISKAIVAGFRGFQLP